jgi:hypothetical protein
MSDTESQLIMVYSSRLLFVCKRIQQDNSSTVSSIQLGWFNVDKPNLIPIENFEHESSARCTPAKIHHAKPSQQQPCQPPMRGERRTCHRTILPTSNPRAALKEYYDQSFVTLTKKHFVTLQDNSNGGHIPQFTAFHVSPYTGEIFPSGQMDGACPNQKNGFWWYKKSDKAQFAAAGLALDCFCHRSNETATESFCNDFPPAPMSLEDLIARGVPLLEHTKISKLVDSLQVRSL